MTLYIVFFAFLYLPNKELNAARSDLVCIKPPTLSALNLPPAVMFSLMLFICTAESSNILAVPIGNCGVPMLPDL